MSQRAVRPLPPSHIKAGLSRDVISSIIKWPRQLHAHHVQHHFLR